MSEIQQSLGSMDALLQWGLTSGTSFLMRLLGGLLILAVGWMIAKWAQRGVVAATERSKLDVALGRFLSQLVRWALLVGVAISSLATMGFEVTTFVAALGAAGFAVGLALQGTLGHFASGVMLLVFRPLNVGDFVNVSGVAGTVQDIGLFATTLLTPENHLVYLPNGAVTGATIINFTRMGTRRAEIDVGVAYGSSLAQVEEAARAAAARVPEVLSEPAVGFVFVEMASSSLNFKLRVWCEAKDFLVVQHKVRSEVYDELNARGIEIPFPQVVVHKADA
jgi:small conductance mechanosensitive channel